MIPPQESHNPDPDKPRRCHHETLETCPSAFVSRSRVLYPPQIEHTLCSLRRKSSSGRLREKTFVVGKCRAVCNDVVVMKGLSGPPGESQIHP